MKGVRCIECGKRPEEIAEYLDAARENDTTPQSYVEQEEGTYNPTNGHFLCTDDFIATEMKLGRRLVGENGKAWIAP